VLLSHVAIGECRVGVLRTDQSKKQSCGSPGACFAMPLDEKEAERAGQGRYRAASQMQRWGGKGKGRCGCCFFCVQHMQLSCYWPRLSRSRLRAQIHSKIYRIIVASREFLITTVTGVGIRSIAGNYRPVLMGQPWHMHCRARDQGS
jgi:hypothetical protein